MGRRDDAQLPEQPVVRMQRMPHPRLDPGPLRGTLTKHPAACDGHPLERCWDAIRPDEGKRSCRIRVRK